MLTLQTASGSRDCSGVSRRDFLRVGSLGTLGGLGLGGLSIANMLAGRALAATSGVDFIRDKAVVVLYLSGGASHIETFNPNMDAPSPYNSLTGEVSTSLPGVTFGGTFPQLGQWADRMAVVRSFHHRVGDHDAAHVHVLTGGADPKDAAKAQSIGSIYARLRGTSHPKTGLPTYAFLGANEVDSQYAREKSRAERGSAPGMLGPAYGPFQHNGEDSTDLATKNKGGNKNGGSARTTSVAGDMKLTVAEDRLDDRRALLTSLDRLRRDADAGGQFDAADKFNQQAFDLILGSASKAFDLSKEDKRLVERYDTRQMKIGHKTFRPSTLGQQMLLARRLVENGAGFVTVHSAGWDMHADGNNPGIVKGMNMLGTTVDKAVSAFLEDLESRGLSDKVLLVITGDFGRTPKVNKNGGRDHWASLGTLAFAGGGLRMGQVIGKSDRNNGEPAEDPVTPQMLLGTVMHTLFDIGQLRVARGVPRDLVQLVENAPTIRHLL